MWGGLLKALGHPHKHPATYRTSKMGRKQAIKKGHGMMYWVWGERFCSYSWMRELLHERLVDDLIKWTCFSIPQFPWGLGNGASPCLNNGPPHCLFPLNSTSFEVSRREPGGAKVTDLCFQRGLEPGNGKERGVCGFMLCHGFDKHHLGTLTEQMPQACLSSLGTTVKRQSVIWPRKGTARKEPVMWATCIQDSMSWLKQALGFLIWKEHQLLMCCLKCLWDYSGKTGLS